MNKKCEKVFDLVSESKLQEIQKIANNAKKATIHHMNCINNFSGNIDWLWVFETGLLLDYNELEMWKSDKRESVLTDWTDGGNRKLIGYKWKWI